MFDKEIWKSFWHQLQIDVADCMQHRVLNFDTAMGIWGLVITSVHPSSAVIVAAVLSAFGIVRKS